METGVGATAKVSWFCPKIIICKGNQSIFSFVLMRAMLGHAKLCVCSIGVVMLMVALDWFTARRPSKGIT